MRVLYYDCFSGISGDMHLGALLDLGVDSEYLKQELSKLSLDSEFSLEIQKASKNGISGTKVNVKLTHHHGEHDHAHHDFHFHTHSHEHRHAEQEHIHHHRTFKNIEDLILSSGLSDAIKQRSLKMFWCVAVAEGKVHGKPPHEVAFHEVGAVDSIVDIVGGAICLEALHVRKIIASKIELGGGFAQCAHGLIPIPAPATLEILHNVPVTLGRVSFETTTPTGAAIIKVNVDAFEDQPSFVISKIGYGLGEKESSIPNVLRVLIGEEKESLPLNDEIVLETNLDDMSPEILSYVQERLFDIGVKDVYTTAITTKKNRLGVKLSVLVSLDKEQEAIDMIFSETTSIGLRRQSVQKIALDRKIICLSTKYGKIHVKCAFFDGRMLKYKAEYEECKKAALEHSVPIALVYENVVEMMPKNDV